MRNAASIVVFSSLAPLVGCNGGEAVTDQTLAAAKQHWKRAEIRNYDLEWMSSGMNQALYRVQVRDDQVERVDQVLSDGQTVELHPAQARYFSVDGLFLTIAEDLAQLRTDHPFGMAKGTSAVLRFSPDAQYGFPRAYRRDYAGSPRPLAIDVIRFEPRASSVPSSHSG